ncbi:LOW QUALITY PROTEIN: hypothetical protein Cgig2_016564 [Carnegiea gigantea]|uniref:Uncharacterized protein n=1 Tax=Carnegiea gigantea TaxID=171969 RepID=A0A9Q1KZY9_9CARY|nr:LOW QUALITY PROTEIN: hypothetical protein Cgig2_016564 [Carnegiea gigantea]
MGRRNVPPEGSIIVDIKFLNIDKGNPIMLSTRNGHEVFFFKHLMSQEIVAIIEVTILTLTLLVNGGDRSPQLRIWVMGLTHLSSKYTLTLLVLAMFLLSSFSGIMKGYISHVSDLSMKKSFEKSLLHFKIENQCLEPHYPCTIPWCNGSLGLLESSNGWVYSAHCLFRLLSSKDAWNCLNNCWIFFWGDSTNVDTIRNMLLFTLGVPLNELDAVSRHFDETFTNPEDRSQSVRITQFWNGHWSVSQVHVSLKTLIYKEHRDLLKSLFNRSVVPNTILFNSGLHDGRYWGRPNEFATVVDYAISVWREIIEGVNKIGFEIPNFIIRSTVVSASFIRYMGLNPSKMDVFNGILLEKLRADGLITRVIDYFDMTGAWHFVLRTSDRYHYGRFPSKRVWKDGQIGHQYFVDLMLGHRMLNKSADSATQWPISGLSHRVGILAAVTLLEMLLVWSVDHSAITIYLDLWSTYRDDKNDILPTQNNPDEVWVNPLQNVSAGPRMSRVEPALDWVSVVLEQNYTSRFMSSYLGHRGEPCKASRTVDIKFLNFDDRRSIVLSTGHAHGVVFQALDESGNVHDCGGDYFEVDLAGGDRGPQLSRDFGNGTCSFILQVHPHFAGTYNVTIILLFRNFEGLHHAPLCLVYDKQLRKVPVTFSRSEANLPELHLCQKHDFTRDVWAGRWTRHAKNDTCEISDDGRDRCLEPEHPCTNSWCSGSLGLLESNGWVYSAHCSFRLFSANDAWNCLNNRWLFFWGDSTHVDTVRNILFILLVLDIVVFNSGLHDADWRQPGKYAFQINHAVITFWKDVIEGGQEKRIGRPQLHF